MQLFTAWWAGCHKTGENVVNTINKTIHYPRNYVAIVIL